MASSQNRRSTRIPSFARVVCGKQNLIHPPSPFRATGHLLRRSLMNPDALIITWFCLLDDRELTAELQGRKLMRLSPGAIMNAGAVGLLPLLPFTRCHRRYDRRGHAPGEG